jgi:hypothetical protein
MKNTQSATNPNYFQKQELPKRFLQWTDKEGKRHKRELPTNCYLLSPLEMANAIFLGDIRFNQNVRFRLLHKILYGVDVPKAIQTLINNKDQHEETHT